LVVIGVFPIAAILCRNNHIIPAFTSFDAHSL
jgi:hypothetical protein